MPKLFFFTSYFILYSLVSVSQPTPKETKAINALTRDLNLVRQRIFGPLHMDNTFFTVTHDKRGQLTQGIDNEKNGALNTELPQRMIDGMGYRLPDRSLPSSP